MRTQILQHLRNFIRTPYNVWIITGSLIIQTVVYFIFFHTNDLVLFPDNGSHNCIFYTDSVDNGNSEILDYSVSDSVVLIKFLLKEGFIKPYIGMGLRKKNDDFFDISQYNQMFLEIEGKDIRNVVINLVTIDPIIDFTGRYPGVYFSHNLDVGTDQKEYIFDLSRFTIPDWWYDAINYSPAASFKPNWKQLHNISISTGYTQSLNTRHSIQIHTIKFIRDNTRLFLISIAIEIFIIGLLGLLFFRRFSKPKPIVITYKPVEDVTQKLQENVFLEYINENFYHANFSMESVAKACNVTERKITTHIQKHFNCNFRAYLNSLRINEAKRLLKESDLNISEIAYKVGFSSPNHFNRVFKSISGKSPSAFIQS